MSEWPIIELNSFLNFAWSLFKTLSKIGNIYGCDLFKPCPNIISDLVKVFDPSTVIPIGAAL